MKPGPVLKERSLDPFSNGIQDAVAATTDSTHESGLVRVMAANPLTLWSANIPHALQNRGSRNSILNTLLYTTLRELRLIWV